MSQWPIEEQHVDALRLDANNVRIAGEVLDDASIANYLIEAENLLELARDILRDGYVDNELPVVSEERGEWVVLEGNRRVGALKAIRSPSLVGKSEPKIRRLLSRYPDRGAPTQIRVMVAPSREEAQPLLARLHTRNPKKSWLREQQAVFYHAQLSELVTVDDLRTIYPSESSSIASFVRMGEMRELIRGLRYDSVQLEQFVKTSQLKMTSFEYAYEMPRIQAALGLAFTKDGLLEKKKLSAGERRGLLHLLRKFQDSRAPLNTRSPELKASRPEHNALVEELQKVVAGRSKKAETHENRDGGPREDKGSSADASRSGDPQGAKDRSGSPSGGAPSNPGEAPTSGGDNSTTDGHSTGNERGPNRVSTRLRLDMSGFTYQGKSAGLRRRFEELRKLDVQTFPNATHDLLRTILECAIKEYFTVHGKPLVGKMLGACISELAKEYQADRRMTVLINNVNRSGKMHTAQFNGTATALNASNHEPDMFVSGPDVHEAWEKIKPIMIEVVGS